MKNKNEDCCACMCAKSLSHVWFCVILWTVVHQAPLSMEFSREEYQHGLPCSPLSSWSNLCLLCVPALAGGFFTTSATWETQGSNPGFPHCSQILYQPQGKPENTITYPFSRGFSWPRNRTGVSCITGGFFTNWAIRGALQLIPQLKQYLNLKKL